MFTTLGRHVFARFFLLSQILGLITPGLTHAQDVADQQDTQLLEKVEKIDQIVDLIVDRADDIITAPDHEKHLADKEQEIKELIEETKDLIEDSGDSEEKQEAVQEMVTKVYLKTMSGITDQDDIQDLVTVEGSAQDQEDAQEAALDMFEDTSSSQKIIMIKTKKSQDDLLAQLSPFDTHIHVEKIFDDNGYVFFEIRTQEDSLLAEELLGDIADGEIPDHLMGIQIIKPEVYEIGQTTSGEQMDKLRGITQYKALDYVSSISALPKVSIGVVDTGIDATHPDLRSRISTRIAGYDFVNKDNDPRDDHIHGTHVAGTIGASMNNAGVVGVNPQAELVALKICTARGYCPNYAIFNAIKYATDKGVDVLNLSLGGRGSVIGNSTCKAISYAIDNGTRVIAAAGNANSPVHQYIPGACPGAITVGAVDSNGQRATFSNYGPGVAVSAPGVDIYSTTPGGAYKNLSGTSMATPHIVGLASIIIAKQPNISQAQLKEKLTQHTKNASFESGKQIGGIVDMVSLMSGLGVSKKVAVAAVEETAPVIEEENLQVAVQEEDGIRISNTSITIKVGETKRISIEGGTPLYTLKRGDANVVGYAKTSAPTSAVRLASADTQDPHPDPLPKGEGDGERSLDQEEQAEDDEEDFCSIVGEEACDEFVEAGTDELAQMGSGTVYTGALADSDEEIDMTASDSDDEVQIASAGAYTVDLIGKKPGKTTVTVTDKKGVKQTIQITVQENQLVLQRTRTTYYPKILPDGYSMSRIYRRNDRAGVYAYKHNNTQLRVSGHQEGKAELIVRAYSYTARRYVYMYYTIQVGIPPEPLDLVSSMTIPFGQVMPLRIGGGKDKISVRSNNNTYVGLRRYENSKVSIASAGEEETEENIVDIDEEYSEQEIPTEWIQDEEQELEIIDEAYIGAQEEIPLLAPEDVAIASTYRSTAYVEGRKLGNTSLTVRDQLTNRYTYQSKNVAVNVVPRKVKLNLGESYIVPKFQLGSIGYITTSSRDRYNLSRYRYSNNVWKLTPRNAGTFRAYVWLRAHNGSKYYGAIDIEVVSPPIETSTTSIKIPMGTTKQIKLGGGSGKLSMRSSNNSIAYLKPASGVNIASAEPQERIDIEEENTYTSCDDLEEGSEEPCQLSDEDLEENTQEQDVFDEDVVAYEVEESEENIEIASALPYSVTLAGARPGKTTLTVRDTAGKTKTIQVEVTERVFDLKYNVGTSIPLQNLGYIYRRGSLDKNAVAVYATSRVTYVRGKKPGRHKIGAYMYDRSRRMRIYTHFWIDVKAPPLEVSTEHITIDSGDIYTFGYNGGDGGLSIKRADRRAIYIYNASAGRSVSIASAGEEAGEIVFDEEEELVEDEEIELCQEGENCEEDDIYESCLESGECELENIDDIFQDVEESQDISIASTKTYSKSIKIMGMTPGETSFTMRTPDGQTKTIRVTVKKKVVNLALGQKMVRYYKNRYYKTGYNSFAKIKAVRSDYADYVYSYYRNRHYAIVGQHNGRTDVKIETYMGTIVLDVIAGTGVEDLKTSKDRIEIKVGDVGEYSISGGKGTYKVTRNNLNVAYADGTDKGRTRVASADGDPLPTATLGEGEENFQISTEELAQRESMEQDALTASGSVYTGDLADVQEIVVGSGADVSSDEAIGIASATDISQKIRVVGMYPGETKMTIRDESGQEKVVTVVVKDRLIKMTAPSSMKLSFPNLPFRAGAYSHNITGNVGSVSIASGKSPRYDTYIDALYDKDGYYTYHTFNNNEGDRGVLYKVKLKIDTSGRSKTEYDAYIKARDEARARASAGYQRYLAESEGREFVEENASKDTSDVNTDADTSKIGDGFQVDYIHLETLGVSIALLDDTIVAEKYGIEYRSEKGDISSVEKTYTDTIFIEGDKARKLYILNNGSKTYLDNDYVDRSTIEINSVSIASSPNATRCELRNTGQYFYRPVHAICVEDSSVGAWECLDGYIDMDQVDGTNACVKSNNAFAARGSIDIRDTLRNAIDKVGRNRSLYNMMIDGLSNRIAEKSDNKKAILHYVLEDAIQHMERHLDPIYKDTYELENMFTQMQLVMTNGWVSDAEFGDSQNLTYAGKTAGEKEVYVKRYTEKLFEYQLKHDEEVKVRYQKEIDRLVGLGMTAYDTRGAAKKGFTEGMTDYITNLTEFSISLQDTINAGRYAWQVMNDPFSFVESTVTEFVDIYNGIAILDVYGKAEKGAYVAINIAMEGVTTVASSAVGAGFVKLGLSADGLLFAGGLLKIVNAAKIAYLAKRISWFWDKFKLNGRYKDGVAKMSPSQANELASKLGYGDPSFKTGYTSPVYYNKKAPYGLKYISKDIDQHGGSVWKGASSIENLRTKTKRSGSYSADLSYLGE